MLLAICPGPSFLSALNIIRNRTLGPSVLITLAIGFYASILIFTVSGDNCLSEADICEHQTSSTRYAGGGGVVLN